MPLCMTTKFYVCILMLQSILLAAGPQSLALHRKLVFAPEPNYRSTVHPRDPYFLTDGVRDQSLWGGRYQEKTVGWQLAELVEMTLDLGQIYKVGRINIYTVGGGRSGVEYPEYALAMVSADGRQYRFASFVASDDWVFGGNAAVPRTIVLPVEQKARYLKLYIRPTGNFFFTDEIEVIESQNAEERDNSASYMDEEQVIDLVERARQLQRDSNVLAERLGEPGTAAGELADDWQAITITLSQLITNLTPQRVSRAEAAFAQFRAMWLRSEYKTDWLSYTAELMDILRYGDLPKDVPEDFSISLYQWQNEFSATTINLVNCSAETMYFRIVLSPLQLQEQTVDSSNIFELRRVRYVRVLNAGLVADPLVLQNEKPFPVAPGQTVQLWLEAYSKGLKSGTYTAALAIISLAEEIAKTKQIVPITLEVADKTFPEKVPFLSRNAAYVTNSARFTSKSPEMTMAAVTDLEKHYINVHMVPPDRIFDNQKPQLSLHKLSKELALRSKADPFILLFLGGKSHLERRFGTFRSPGWESRFQLFLTRLRDYMLGSGFAYDDFALFPFDETIGDDFVYLAQIIRDFDPYLKIYANKWIEPEDFNKVKDLIDIWSLHIPDVLTNKATYERYLKMGVFDQIWCYHANLPCERYFAPPKMRTSRQWRGENRTFWRTMPMVAASLEMQGAGFWAYQDLNRTGWIKDKQGEWGVVYDGTENPDKHCIPELIVPSKRWQQWRLGIQDAVCLMEHKSMLDEFFRTPSAKLSSEYLKSLRKGADNVK